LKKDWAIVLFTVIYINIFTFIYAYIFNYLKGYLLIMLLFMIINIPSLLLLIFLRSIERYNKKIISIYVYLLVTLGLTSTLLLNWKKLKGDPKNIFPLFQENEIMLFTICASSYLIAFTIIKLTIKLKTRHA